MKKINKKNRVIIEICLMLGFFIVSIPLDARNWGKVNDVTNPFDSELQIFDINGKFIFFKKVSDNEYLLTNFLKEGIYFAKIKTNKGEII
jgi:hypothetical protein